MLFDCRRIPKLIALPSQKKTNKHRENVDNKTEVIEKI